MSQVLYRKYRSQTFDELIGQSHITNLLKNAVIQDSLSHAYLFVGSRGTGKTSIARILAKAVNCTNPTKEGNPCNECSACKSVMEGNFLDLIEIDAASNRGIDQIRELKERIEFSPTEGKYKVYIIDEVHMLTKEAFNALLKTLEEPPSHVIFMLATTDVHKLPATILSRCQRYDFRLGSEDEVADVINKTAKAEGVKLEKKALKLLVESAAGSYRDSLSLLDVVVSGQLKGDDPATITEAEVRTILGIPDTTMVYYLLEKIVKNDVKAALKLIKELESKGVNIQQFVKYVLVMLRDVLVKKAIDELKPTEYGFAVELSERRVIQLINGFIGIDRSLRNAHMPALMLEIFIVEQTVVPNEVVSKASGSSNSNGDNGGNDSPPAKEVRPEAKKKEDSKKKDPVKSEKKPKDSDAVVVEVTKEEITVSAVEEESEVVSKEEKVEKVVSEEPVNLDPGKIPKGITIKDIEEKWDGVIKAAQKFNGHLYAFLKTAQLAEIRNDTLIVQVPFEFHKERIEDPKTMMSVHTSFKEVYGFIMTIKCEVNAAAKRKKKSSADIVLKSLEQAKQSLSVPATPVQEKPKYGGGGKDGAPAKRGVSKKVEAIFEGM
jgi:DNA polymerase III subunit gamma/tau